MFVLFLLFTVACISISVLAGCRFIKHQCCRYVVFIMAAAVTVVSTSIFTIDLIAYLKGGVTTTSHIAISQTKVTENLDYFTVNNRYWSIGGNFQKHRTITAITPDIIKFKLSSIDSLTERNEFIIYYLPASKFITQMEVLITGRNSKVTGYSFFESCYYACENKITGYIAILSVLVLIGVTILTALKKRI